MDERTLARIVASYGDVSDTAGLAALAARHAAWMMVSGYSPATALTQTRELGLFVRWCEQRGLARATDVTVPVVERYQRWLYEHRTRKGRPLTLATQKGRLIAVNGLFRWLVQQHLVPYNPAADLQLPRLGRRLPRDVMTYEEVERVLRQPDVAEPLGLRDRAAMEVLYSTGLRRQELARLRLHDLAPDRGTLLVREGKGRRDRVVPIGTRALEWVRRWLVDVRTRMVVPPDEHYLFVGRRGRPMTTNGLTDTVRKYVLLAGLGAKRGACHLFRHTMATLMLENGADVRYIQELLGHVSLATTELYTHVSIVKLKEVHGATHPAEVGVLERPGAVVPEALREQLSEAIASEEEREEESN
jgi:integrase/recombinase XerD